MAGGAVDEGGVGDVFAVVDKDGPDIDKSKQRNVGEFLQREEEGEHVVGDALREAVERVERMARKRGRHDPLVVRLVQALVEFGVVQPAMDPVDEEVGEGDEKGELEEVVKGKGGVVGAIVEEGVAADFGNEEGSGEDGHDGEGGVGLFDFERDLVFEVFGVREGGVVEDEEVGEAGAEVVDDEAEEPGEGRESQSASVKGGEGGGLSDGNGGAEYHVIRYRLTVCLQMLSRGQALI